jgi:ubiquitin-conjugating enzyme E2 Z
MLTVKSVYQSLGMFHCTALHSRYIHSSTRYLILNHSTWTGDKNEKWSPAQGIDSILHSIQSLLSSNPYLNEPSFEDDLDEEAHRDYNAKITHEVIRISVVQTLRRLLEPISPKKSTCNDKKSHPDCSDENADTTTEEKDSQEDNVSLETQLLELCRQRFHWYYDFYLEAITRESALHKDGEIFEKAEWEVSDTNWMAGSFQYSTLRHLLKTTKHALDAQVDTWVTEGLTATQMEKPIAVHAIADFKDAESLMALVRPGQVELEMRDGQNPFVWHLIIYSQADGPLEGAVIVVRIVISQRFPLEQPHVTVETPLFHHRISSERNLAYVVKGDSTRLADHVSSIVTAIVEPCAGLEQRICANPEASKLIWGCEVLGIKPDMKAYRSKVRKSAERTFEA